MGWLSIVGRRRVVVVETASSPSSSQTSSILPSISSQTGHAQSVQDNTGNCHEHDHEQDSGVAFGVVSFRSKRWLLNLLGISSLSFVCQQEVVSDSAASFQDIRVITALVAFARYICDSKLEFFRQ